MTRREWLSATAAVIAVRGASPKTPNFVLITCSDMGCADIEPYRPGVGYTAHLSRKRSGAEIGSLTRPANSTIWRPASAKLRTSRLSARIS